MTCQHKYVEGVFNEGSHEGTYVATPLHLLVVYLVRKA
jgi:hypothetical protein